MRFCSENDCTSHRPDGNSDTTATNEVAQEDRKHRRNEMKTDEEGVEQTGPEDTGAWSFERHAGCRVNEHVR